MLTPTERTCPNCGKPQTNGLLADYSWCFPCFTANASANIGPDHPSQPWNQVTKR
jgi:hypothetical protein